jgi:peptidylprolyl isomerase
MRIPILASLLLIAASPPPVAKPGPTPGDIVATAPTAAWKDIPDDNLLVITLAGGRRVVIQLTTRFSQQHVANMRALASAHWWDGTAIYRVQDNYVAQWGNRSEKKPLPDGVPQNLPQDYSANRKDIAAPILAMPSRDSYALATGFLDGWPVAMDDTQVWLPHCYGMVGVARNLAPDAGTGAELYAVIGQSPRHLDRNIALVGRVIDGIENLSALPRGTEPLGLYGANQSPTPILSAQIASAISVVDRPHFQTLDTASPAFSAYANARANRHDAFFNVAAGGADICNIPVPVRNNANQSAKSR